MGRTWPAGHSFPMSDLYVLDRGMDPFSAGTMCASLCGPGGPGVALRHPGTWIQEQHRQHHEAVVGQGPLRLQPRGL